MTRKIILATLLAWPALPAAALEIPLYVRERAGVQRAGNPVDAGFPLPRGAVADVSKLGLFVRDIFTVGDEPVPATFVIRERYWPDRSARWVTVHFLGYVGANERKLYIVKDRNPGEIPYPVQARADANSATVDTGAVRFQVTRSNFNILQQAWYDPTRKGKYASPIVSAGGAKLTAGLRTGKYHVVDSRAVIDVIGGSFEATAKVAELKLEENWPGRAVVKVSGTFMNGIRPVLDFVARLYATAGGSSIRVSFTVINSYGRTWEDFCGIEELAWQVPVRLGSGPMSYTLSAPAGLDAGGQLAPEASAWLLQPNSEDCLMGGAANGRGHCKSIASRRVGWADLTGRDAGAAVGIRDFWQTHPKGLAVGGDGTLTVRLVPRQAEAAAAGGDVVSEPLTRIDLFAGAARTQEFMIAFHPPEEAGRYRIMAVVDPLFATARPQWYCQESEAEGPLLDADAANFKPEYRDLVATFDGRIGAALKAIAAARDGAEAGMEAYGLLNFGSGLERFGYRPAHRAIDARWCGNGNDFARAALVHFWRTGEQEWFDLAQAAALHQADMGIVHANPDDPKAAGVERTCPNVGHVRTVAGNYPFGAAGDMQALCVQGLFDLYHMTGEARYRDCAMLVGQYAADHTAMSLRAVGNRARVLHSTYLHAGREEYLTAEKNWLTEMILPRRPSEPWGETWAYGLAAEPLMELFRLTGERKWAEAVVRCCDALVTGEWRSDDRPVRMMPGVSVNCFGYAYELTGNPEYLRKGLILLGRTGQPAADRMTTFAQSFRTSPYFLAYLGKDFKLADPPPLAPPQAGKPPEKPAPPPAKPPIDEIPGLPPDL